MSRTKKFTIAAIVVVVLILFTPGILWLITMADKVQFHVVDSDLTQFNFTDDSQLVFNLGLNMTVKNPRRGFGIYFDIIEVGVLYQDIEFSNMSLSPFYQGEEGTRQLKMKFDGQQVVKLNAEQLAVFTLEKIAEMFSIEVELRLQIRVRIGPIKIKIKPKVHCGLNVPLISRGRSLLRSRIIGCHVAY